MASPMRTPRRRKRTRMDTATPTPPTPVTLSAATTTTAMATMAMRLGSPPPSSNTGSSGNSNRPGRRPGQSRRRQAAAAASTTPPTAEATTRVVWRDSPVDKQIRVSGTGKLAVQREMQGFVGRLERASLPSPPPPASKSRGHLSTSLTTTMTTAEAVNASSRVHGLPLSSPSSTSAAAGGSTNQSTRKRKARALLTMTVPPPPPQPKTTTPTSPLPSGALLSSSSDGRVASSSHILFSPEEPHGAAKISGELTSPTFGRPVRPRRGDSPQPDAPPRPQLQRQSSSTTSRGDESQDELLLLDQMDERLSRQDATGIDTSDGLGRVVAAPRVVAAAPTAPVRSARTANVLTPPPVVVTEAAKSEFESPDFTDESWELLDQIELQASQQIAQRNNGLSQQQYQPVRPPRPGHQMPKSSSSGHSLTPPSQVPNHGTPTMTASTARCQVVKASSSARSPIIDKRLDFDDAALSGDTKENLTRGDAFHRCLVLETDRDQFNRRLLVRLLDAEDRHLQAALVDDWYDTPVEAGDTINLILSDRNHRGVFDSKRTNFNSCSSITVNNNHNFVVVHPDVLVSPTSVTTSFGCLRRAVLRETLNVSRPTHQKALLGTLKHELFQYALVSGDIGTESLLNQARGIVNNHVLDLVESGINEDTAMTELRRVVDGYQRWMIESRSSGVLLNEPPLSDFAGARVLVHEVLAVEEMLWSLQWGLKGAIDASIRASFTPRPDHTVVIPLELKTGSKMYGGVEHQGQVILYTMLLNERYQQDTSDEALLLYAPGIETNRIAAVGSHTRGLILARNKYASALARVKALGGTTSDQQQHALPPMLRNPTDCRKCFQVDECVLHHASVEHGNAETSGLGELFDEKAGHLTESDKKYFHRWNHLIDLEQQFAEKNLRALWLQSGKQRERDPDGICLSNLCLIRDDLAPRGSTSSGSIHALHFRRDQRQSKDVSPVYGSFLEQRFRVDDRVILSAESMDGKTLLVHVAKARVVSISSDQITVEAYQSVPKVVSSGQSVVGKSYTWRLDKDSILSGLSRAKDNLVKLFVGPAPETITAGVSESRRGDIYPALTQMLSQAPNDINRGDRRRRALVVHLEKPRFRSNRLIDILFPRGTDSSEVDNTLATQARSLYEAFLRLNIDQQRAVSKVMNALDYALILGMPGTGKTSTIAFTVRLLVFLGHSVLITSYTHSAVDNLLLKLIPYNISMLRIGNSAQIHPQLARFSLDESSERDGSRSVENVQSRFYGAQVVGCTCLSVNSHVLFSKRRFDFCIVDEATQTTEPVVLGPLRCADTFVLVGDHYQLPPLVANPRAKRDGMDVSLFKKLSEAHPEAIQQLSYQYRMNGDIMTLANRLIYGDKLKCGSIDVTTNKLELVFPRDGHSWPARVLSSPQGVVFLNTDNVPSASEILHHQTGLGRGRKLENLVEARVVAGLIAVLIAGAVPPDDIAVISPFRSQVALILQHIRHLEIATAGIEVSTIDKYQGKDKSVVIVSFVRTNDSNNVGELLTDWRRINVALTRAKRKLVLIGSKKTLYSGSMLFRSLMELVDERKWETCLQPDSLITLDNVVRCLKSYATNGKQLDNEPEPDLDPQVFRLSQGRDDVEDIVNGTVPVKLRAHTNVFGTTRTPSITNDILGHNR